MQSNSILQAIS